VLVSLAAAQDNINIENRCGPRSTTTCEPRCAHGVQNGTPGEIPGAKVSRENVRFPRSRRSGIISAWVRSSVVELDCVVASRDAITSRFRRSAAKGSTEQLHLEAHVAPHVSLHTLRQSGVTFTSRFRLCVVTADDVVFVFARSRYDSID